ncbi:MAG TPA: hypothetical protein VI455_17220 [Terriglobia bacterium]
MKPCKLSVSLTAAAARIAVPVCPAGRGRGAGLVRRLMALLCFQTAALLAAPQTSGGSPQVPVVRPQPPLLHPARPPTDSQASSPDASPDDATMPGDWAPELLDTILSSTNPAASEALYDAAFAAGPDIIPQLQAALRDDRTAEFAAQCLAFLGGDKATTILQGLVADPRDLDLRRFYLGALGEYKASEITQLLLKAVGRSDLEPDRTVTEAAVWSLTVRSDPELVPQLKKAETKIEDPVIRDDVENAEAIIETRARYLASPEGKNAGASIPGALHTYFIAALQDEPGSAPKRPGALQTPQAKVEVGRVTFTPDQTRALAHAALEDPEATANYDVVLQKQLGDWAVVSVWEGSSTEVEAPEPPSKTSGVQTKKPASQTSRRPQPSPATKAPE